MLIKTLGISQLIYSASNLDTPKGIVEIVRTKSFKFVWKNKKDKIKRLEIYQDLDNGGIRMIDFDIMLKALKLTWIPRLLRTSDNIVHGPGQQNFQFLTTLGDKGYRIFLDTCSLYFIFMYESYANNVAFM